MRNGEKRADRSQKILKARIRIDGDNRSRRPSASVGVGRTPACFSHVGNGS